jgi:hypothetical protein
MVQFIRFGLMVPMVVLVAGSNFSGHLQTSWVGMDFNTPAVAAPPTQNIAAKTAQFLEQYGGTYTKASDSVWVVPFKGKSLGSFDVYVATDSKANLLLIGVTVAKKQNLKSSQTLFHQLLKYNHSADYVKVGLDDDEDLFLRAELNAKTTDFQSFKETLEQVAAATDGLYAQIKPNLVGNP